MDFILIYISHYVLSYGERKIEFALKSTLDKKNRKSYKVYNFNIGQYISKFEIRNLKDTYHNNKVDYCSLPMELQAYITEQFVKAGSEYVIKNLEYQKVLVELEKEGYNNNKLLEEMKDADLDSFTFNDITFHTVDSPDGDVSIEPGVLPPVEKEVDYSYIPSEFIDLADHLDKPFYTESDFYDEDGPGNIVCQATNFVKLGIYAYQHIIVKCDYGELGFLLKMGLDSEYLYPIALLEVNEEDFWRLDIHWYMPTKYMNLGYNELPDIVKAYISEKLNLL